jgi:hypothetical protein
MTKSYYVEQTDKGLRFTLDDNDYSKDTGLFEEAIGIGCVVGFILFLVLIW